MISSGCFTHSKFCFPVGEMHVRIDDPQRGGTVDILFEFQKNEDLIELLLVVDALKRLHTKIGTLKIPYVPFSRQDRVAVEGECLSLAVFANLINSIGAQRVQITDPHSDVTTALINNVDVIAQAEVFDVLFSHLLILKTVKGWLIAPDAGALKKTYKLAEVLHPLGVIECGKRRDPLDGKITGVVVHADDLQGAECYIADDICDGGKTFVEIAKVLKTKNAGKITLLVTHGFFTKGLGVFDGLIDHIFTSKGQIK